MHAKIHRNWLLDSPRTTSIMNICHVLAWCDCDKGGHPQVSRVYRQATSCQKQKDYSIVSIIATVHATIEPTLYAPAVSPIRKFQCSAPYACVCLLDKGNWESSAIVHNALHEPTIGSSHWVQITWSREQSHQSSIRSIPTGALIRMAAKMYLKTQRILILGDILLGLIPRDRALYLANSTFHKRL